jgi:uncharacterized membrane protein YhaH (DUF805 family)
MFWLLKCLKQFADFKGRARRKEYWMFTLFNLIFSVVASTIGVFGNIPDLGTIFYLVMLIPSLAVAVRRVHDVGKSGWYLLIPIYNLVLVLTEGIEANLGI